MATGIPGMAVSASAKPAMPSGFVDILRAPDSVVAFAGGQRKNLVRDGQRWSAGSLAVEAQPLGKGEVEIPVRIEAPGVSLERVRLRWLAPVPESWRVLNDQWERSYGDLEWRGLVAERPLPWYFLAFDGRSTHGYGVRTGAGALCFWQVDSAGVSLWLDVRYGARGVQLGERRLDAAVILTRRGKQGETPFQAARAFCRLMCPKPLMPAVPIYGGNNWYYAYGKSSHAEMVHDTDVVAEAAGSQPNRPFMVMDEGWEPSRRIVGPWDRGNDKFPDMAKLASDIKERGVRPGLWIRPIYTTAPFPESWKLKIPAARARSRDGGYTLDPTVPEALDQVRLDVGRIVKWGFELVKHDFTTFDLLGRWGFSMGAEPTDEGWTFADRGRTTAEIILALYRAIREACGSALVIGCNTMGHLGAGLFELQRIGDDTSGRDFDRTRRMGVNTLAFRAAQHGTFFAVDADCAPITPQLPWAMAERWLDLLARSGTPLFVSADPRGTGPEQKAAIQRAFAVAARPGIVAEPLDWLATATPRRWLLQGKPAEYDWFGAEGATPFPR